MSQPILTRNLQVINSVADASVNSASIDISDCTVIAVQALWTGAAPAGSVTIEGSLDGSTWNTFGASSITVSGASGSGLVNFSPAAMPFIRVNFTKTGGTVATFTAFVSTKQPA